MVFGGLVSVNVPIFTPENKIVLQILLQKHFEDFQLQGFGIMLCNSFLLLPAQDKSPRLTLQRLTHMQEPSRKEAQRGSDMDSSSSRRVLINVGGVRFETYAATLLSFPGTKLASLAELSPSESANYDPEHGEFFFDRNPEVFGSILDFYRTRRLHCPRNVCAAMLRDEMSFWEVNFTQLSHCCWTSQTSRELEDFCNETPLNNDDQQLLLEAGREDNWRGRWQPKVWRLFQKPYSSLASMCVTIISILFNVGAIIIFFEETNPHFSYVMNHTRSSEDDSAHTFQQEMDLSRRSYLLYLELLCAFFFLLHYVARFFFCPNRRDFMMSPLNWADFLSIFPAFIELLARGHTWAMNVVWKVLSLMRLTYIIRLFRLVLLMEHGLVLRVLSGTLRAIAREILILLLVLVLETLFFGTLAFYAEWLFVEDRNGDEHFVDLYISCWWAIITLTGVGYGDVYPIQAAGRVVSSLAAICGVLTIVLPVPILLIKFQHYYSVALAKEKRRVQHQL